MTSRKTPRTPLGDRLRTFGAGYKGRGMDERGEAYAHAADTVDQWFEEQRLVSDNPLDAFREAATIIQEAAADLVSAVKTVGRPTMIEVGIEAPKARVLSPLLDPLPRRPRAQSNGAAHPGEPGGKKPGERAILTACAQHKAGVTKKQLTVLTGYKRSTRDAYLLRLGNRGVLETNGERILATAAGLAELGPGFKPLPTGRKLVEHCRETLPPGEWRFVELLLMHVGGLTRDQLTELTGYQRSTRDAYLHRLRARELVEIDGSDVTASEHLR
jgi:hypothetical protein